MSEFKSGEIYPVTLRECNQIIASMGMGAILVTGSPDPSRGRRCIKADDHSAEWEFWTTTQHKVSFSVCRGMGPMHDHFIASCSNEPDPSAPPQQFEVERQPAKPARKCIKPDCQNMVAPIGVKKPEPGIFKNYRATGACQQGHNIYYCEKCEVPHSYASKVGIAHYDVAAQPTSSRGAESVPVLRDSYGRPYVIANAKEDAAEPGS